MMDDAALAAYVDAAAVALAIPLDGELRAGVLASLARVAAFAADVAAFEIGHDVEIAGEFVP
jgi:hypothetical protein